MAADTSNEHDLKENEEGLLLLIDSLKLFERQFDLDNRFNLFEAINMARQEVRHSRFLAFLLDPLSPHGLGDRFLRAVLAAAIAEHPNSPVSRLDAAIADLSGASVHCERDHFDVTVEVPSLRLLFVIENKVDAAEGKGQLAKYRSRAEARYSNDRFLGCFLTPDGYEGEDEQWGTMSYTTIVAELRRLAEDSAPSAEVLVAIRHYIQLIERKIVTSQALVDACRSIYRQHRTALDLILDHGQESMLGQAYEQFAAETHAQTALKVTALRSTTVFFLFESWLKIDGYPQADRKRWTSTFPVVLWFEVLNKRMNLRVEVGPFLDPGKAKAAFLERFPDQWIDARSRTGGKGIYSRIKKATTSVPEDPTSEELFEAMKKLWAAAIPWDVENVVQTVVEDVRSNVATPGISPSAPQQPIE